MNFNVNTVKTTREKLYVYASHANEITPRPGPRMNYVTDNFKGVQHETGRTMLALDSLVPGLYTRAMKAEYDMFPSLSSIVVRGYEILYSTNTNINVSRG